MGVKLERISPSASVITLSNGNRILYSYEVPVAAEIEGTFYKSSKYFSRTTNGHISAWLINAQRVEVLPHAEFLELIGSSDKEEINGNH